MSRQLSEYLDRVRAIAPLRVCAGFGIGSRVQVDGLRGHVDGVVVGSALVEVLERGEDADAFLRGAAAALMSHKPSIRLGFLTGLNPRAQPKSPLVFATAERPHHWEGL